MTSDQLLTPPKSNRDYIVGLKLSHLCPLTSRPTALRAFQTYMTTKECHEVVREVEGQRVAIFTLPVLNEGSDNDRQINCKELE